MPDLFLISKLFAVGILLVQIDFLVILGAFIVNRDGWITDIVRTYALLLVTLAGLIAIVGSLTYSEIFGFEPCKLCWFQRIFLYPSFFIGLIGYYFKDKNALRYTLALSLVGIFISIYHYTIQMTGVSLIPCSAVGQSSACSGTYVQEFGYITIPMMALTLNAYVIAASWIGLSQN